MPFRCLLSAFMEASFFSHPHTRQDGHTPDRTQGAVQAHTAKETLEAREHARQGESTSGNQTRNAIEAHNQQPPARTEQRARAQAASPRQAEATRCGPPLATATMAAFARAITIDARSKNWCCAATASHPVPPAAFSCARMAR